MPCKAVPVYERPAPAARAALHRTAARLLFDRAAPHDVTSHLVLTHGAGERWAVDILRAAAREASALVRTLREELVASGGRPRRARTHGPGSLTAGERRVALLAADGLTNRQIADALFVTPKAIGFHLGNVYRKLAIPGREHLPVALERTR